MPFDECFARRGLRTGIENPEDLRPYLLCAWRAETSVAPRSWSPSNPAFGQCAVTALVVQDLFGGELLRGHIFGGTHYWNLLPNGREVDLTAEQFDVDPVICDVELRSRAYVLAYPATRARYQCLLVNLGFEPQDYSAEKAS